VLKGKHNGILKVEQQEFLPSIAHKFAQTVTRGLN